MATNVLRDRSSPKYYKLFPSLIDRLSSWAVTSLSTRGRLPLGLSFFDPVVIDEASQCDIVSALPLLFRAKPAVIMGDLKQLGHISAIPPTRRSGTVAQARLG